MILPTMTSRKGPIGAPVLDAKIKRGYGCYCLKLSHTCDTLCTRSEADRIDARLDKGKHEENFPHDGVPTTVLGLEYGHKQLHRQARADEDDHALCARDLPTLQHNKSAIYVR